MNTWFPIVSAADREVGAGFAAAVYVNIPLPVPLTPEVIVSHAALLTAVHP